MDLVQRALVWEAREPDLYVNVYFSFPWADVPDVGMTIQAISNGNAALAARAAEDVAAFAWRRRAELVKAATVLSMEEGVRRAVAAQAAGAAPVVLGDHSDRSGAATWLLREIIAQDVSGAVVATVADFEAVAALKGARPGDGFDRLVGGRLDRSAGEPIRVVGRMLDGDWSNADPAKHWVTVSFGRSNVLVLTPYLTQVMYPAVLGAWRLDATAFEVFAIKSRVHFRRGFDDSGFAPTILLVEPDEPFLGTVRLEGLRYENVDISGFYPYGREER
jgi:microcystin degradation protein MlrC